MNRLAARSVMIALAVAGCGGNNNSKPTDGGANSGDAGVQCTAVAPGTLDIVSYDPTDMNAAWTAPITGDLGDGNSLAYNIEIFGGIETNLAGTFDLTAGNQANYSSCAICVHGFALDSTGTPVKQFFQSGGSVTLADDPLAAGLLMGSFTDLKMQEVTIDGTSFASTPVAGGECAAMGSYSVDHDQVPNAWTCTHDKYADGATCDCMCGTSDPDCDVGGAPVMGCAAQQTCFNDMCETPPANDTCQTAVALTLGTAATGTTVGAHDNYDSGLEGTTCTGDAQAGPDVAYSITLTAAQAYTVTLSNLDADYDGSIALVGPGTAAAVCDANPISTCVAGADIGFEGDPETFQYTPTATGTYFIIVDSFYADEAGAFTLTVTSP